MLINIKHSTCDKEEFTKIRLLSVNFKNVNVEKPQVFDSLPSCMQRNNNAGNNFGFHFHLRRVWSRSKLSELYFSYILTYSYRD